MLKSHRDLRRDNKANAVIQGTIMSMINKSSLDKIKAIINIKYPEIMTGDKRKELDDAIEVALQSATEMTSRYMTCQREMNVRGCSKYASQQFGIMKRATLLKDNIMLEQGLSNFIVTENMVAMMEIFLVMVINQVRMIIVIIHYHHFNTPPTLCCYLYS